MSPPFEGSIFPGYSTFKRGSVAPHRSQTRECRELGIHGETEAGITRPAAPVTAEHRSMRTESNSEPTFHWSNVA